MSLTRTEFNRGLESLRARLLEMGLQVDAMLRDALEAMTTQDLDMARRVIRRDDVIDDMDVEIEMECMRLIAIEAPVARDLRLIGTAMKLIADIERIGDYAADIAKIARRLTKNLQYRPLVDLQLLTDMAREMVRDAMAAFINHDLDLVRKVIDADDAVDTLYHQQRNHLMDVMEQDSTAVRSATFMLLAAKYLERVADHAVNIAERVQYVETGQLAKVAKPEQVTP